MWRQREELWSQYGGTCNRDSFTKHVTEWCHREGKKRGYKSGLLFREALRILAADRAQLYFRGNIQSVGLQEIIALAETGSDILIVEKEGVCERLARFASRYGVALLNIRGHINDYPLLLSDAMERTGGKIFVLTDLDLDGLDMYLKVASLIGLDKTHRIGIGQIDFEHEELSKSILGELGISEEQAREPYSPVKKGRYRRRLQLTQWDPEKRKDVVVKSWGSLIWLADEVKTHRIEIDSILQFAQCIDEDGNQLRGAEAFWHYVIEQIEKVRPRNLNRSITLSAAYPEKVDQIIEKLRDLLTDTGNTLGKWQYWQDAFEKWGKPLLRVSNVEDRYRRSTRRRLGELEATRELQEELGKVVDSYEEATTRVREGSG